MSIPVAAGVEPYDWLARFAALDSFLHSHRQWWQINPFHHRQMLWREQCPDLVGALDDLSDDEVEDLDADPQALANWLAPWIEQAPLAHSLSQLPVLKSAALAAPARLEVGVPGRKWSQIQAFAACLPKVDSPLLEWCSGKGHLGRLIAMTQACAVTSLEWRADLCSAGVELAEKCACAQRFVHADAFDSAAGELLGQHPHAVALHACGDLHVQLIQQWLAAAGDLQNRSLALAPCCYHLIRAASYQPLSQIGIGSGLRLTKSDLQLPLQQTVTAGAGVRRLRDRELHWRLAFDQWQRDARGIDEYLPLPSFRKSLLSQSFGEFMAWAAAVKNLSLGAHWREQPWLAQGAHRVALVRRMELVAHLFRRPLELWLVLDRAIYLQEGGAVIDLGTFCDAELTPRNILLRANR